jgi:hypothetical protein
MPIPLGILAVAGASASSAGAFDLLETTILTSDTASVSFSSLGSYSDYKHLQIRATLRTSATGSALGDLRIKFNGSSSAIYSKHTLRGNGNANTTTSENTVNDTQMEFANVAAQSGNNSAIFGVIIMDIYDFASTNKTTTIRGIGGGNTGSESIVTVFGGLFNSTAAITSIVLDFANVNWILGSRFSLYGVKA